VYWLEGIRKTKKNVEGLCTRQIQNPKKVVIKGKDKRDGGGKSRKQKRNFRNHLKAICHTERKRIRERRWKEGI